MSLETEFPLLYPRKEHPQNEQRLHRSSKDSCERCARHVDRAGSWVRVQQALLRRGPSPDGGRSKPRTPDTDSGVPDSRVLKALLHRAETASSTVQYLYQKGPAISIPQHLEDISAAEAAEQRAWSDFKKYAEGGEESEASVEIEKRLAPRYR